MGLFRKFNISRTKHPFWLKILVYTRKSLDLSMDRISDRNTLIWFCCRYFALDRKFCKRLISFEQQTMSTNNFGVFLVLQSPACKQNISSKARNQLGQLTRETCPYNLTCIDFSNIVPSLLAKASGQKIQQLGKSSRN